MLNHPPPILEALIKSAGVVHMVEVPGGYMLAEQDGTFSRKRKHPGPWKKVHNHMQMLNRYARFKKTAAAEGITMQPTKQASATLPAAVIGQAIKAAYANWTPNYGRDPGAFYPQGYKPQASTTPQLSPRLAGRYSTFGGQHMAPPTEPVRPEITQRPAPTVSVAQTAARAQPTAAKPAPTQPAVQPARAFAAPTGPSPYIPNVGRTVTTQGQQVQLPAATGVDAGVGTTEASQGSIFGNSTPAPTPVKTPAPAPVQPQAPVVQASSPAPAPQVGGPAYWSTMAKPRTIQLAPLPIPQADDQDRATFARATGQGRPLTHEGQRVAEEYATELTTTQARRQATNHENAVTANLKNQQERARNLQTGMDQSRGAGLQLSPDMARKDQAEGRGQWSAPTAANTVTTQQSNDLMAKLRAQESPALQAARNARLGVKTSGEITAADLGVGGLATLGAAAGLIMGENKLIPKLADVARDVAGESRAAFKATGGDKALTKMKLDRGQAAFFKVKAKQPPIGRAMKNPAVWFGAGLAGLGAGGAFHKLKKG